MALEEEKGRVKEGRDEVRWLLGFLSVKISTHIFVADPETDVIAAAKGPAESPRTQAQGPGVLQAQGAFAQGPGRE